MIIEYLLKIFYSLTLVLVSYTDLRRRVIPNKVMYPAILLALGGLLFPFEPDWKSAMLGSIVGIVVLAIPIFFYGSNSGLAGMGDVKLGFFIGLILGFPATPYALIIAFCTGAIVGLVGIASHNLTRKSTLPFAPFLALGALALLWF